MAQGQPGAPVPVPPNLALETDLRLMPEARFRIFRLGQWVEGYELWLGQDGRAVWMD